LAQKEEKPGPPMVAIMGPTNPLHQITVIYLNLYGKQLPVTFMGPKHNQEAVDQANEWNAHFANVNGYIMQMVGRIIDDVMNNLREEGVDEEVLARAVGRAKVHTNEQE